MHLKSPLPSLEGATAWLNGKPETVGGGRPVFVHFWAVSCPVCKESMPQVNGWRDTYAPRGLQVISVHMPLRETDTDLGQVRETAEGLGITQPVAVDSELAISDRFENQYTPAYYVFDGEGKLRHYQAGNRAMDLVERRLQRVVEEAARSPAGG
ncbi:redoxin domain-containing protein [Limnochorda pilosa]|uniref:Thiol-disulfide oxidoreductase n=1 Tax=Limnochorda pilosa TaxID=1555112 RepID=A0A0K2SJF7_LIMPI|nr:thiol-disulfide oxidoreductase [Limnochorda pilosa]